MQRPDRAAILTAAQFAAELQLDPHIVQNWCRRYELTVVDRVRVLDRSGRRRLTARYRRLDLLRAEARADAADTGRGRQRKPQQSSAA